MAANGPSVRLALRDLVPLNGPVTQVEKFPISDSAGLPLTKGDTSGYTAIFQVPYGSTLTTGLTFRFTVVDDGNDATDLSKVAVLGVTCKKLADNTDTFSLATGAATEQTGNATLAATAGVLRVVEIAVTTANADSPSAGDELMVRIRRVGTSASDTLYGPLVLHSVDVYAY